MDATTIRRARTPLSRPNPLVVAWRWRYELALAVGVPLLLRGLVLPIGAWRAVAATTAVAAVLLAWPAARRLLVARVRCIVTPHRVRTGCAEAHIQTRAGKLPIILWTSPVPLGERVLVWCRSGTAAEDFEGARRQLRTACWARDVIVTRSPGRAHLVTVTVIRHGPPPGAPPALGSQGGYTWSRPPADDGLGPDLGLRTFLPDAGDEPRSA